MSASTSAKIYRGTPRNLALLARALTAGEVVAVPTETVYGLAGDALNTAAVKKIFRAKGRPTNDPLIVHIHSLAQLDQLAERNAAVEKIARAFWPGPLTLILPKKPVVPDLVTSGRPSVAIRMPNHPLFRKLLRDCGRPLAAPSANPFGYVSPTTAAHVLDGLGRKIRYILDGGSCAIGVESTILDLRDPKRPAILRPGAIEGRAIERVLRVPVKAFDAKPQPANTASIAPGLLTRHYSPRTPVELRDQLPPPSEVERALRARLPVSDAKRPTPSHNTPGRRVPPHELPPATDAFLYFRRPAEFVKTSAPKNIFWLTQNGDLRAAAKALFASLRKLDAGRWIKIHAEQAPGDNALALAINDRLTRAAAKR
jgi:L-threonylcarbamoyladenylate synthase